MPVTGHLPGARARLCPCSWAPPEQYGFISKAGKANSGRLRLTRCPSGQQSVLSGRGSERLLSLALACLPLRAEPKTTARAGMGRKLGRQVASPEMRHHGPPW